MSKRLAIGVLYVAFGATLVVSGLSTRPLGVAIGLPFLAVGLGALRPRRRGQ